MDQIIPDAVQHFKPEEFMNINGRYQSLEGKTFKEIGELLQEASLSKDGIGLRLELTEEEELIFIRNFGMTIGHTICNIIRDAVRGVGGNPTFRYTYDERVFETMTDA